jgi:Nuclease-related domain
MTDVATAPGLGPAISSTAGHRFDAAAASELPLTMRLDLLGPTGVLSLHERRIPLTGAIIDHLVISTSGVYVIDAKRYAGAPRLLVEGGIISPQTSTLIVGGRDCTRLVDTVHRQGALVRTELEVDENWAGVPVHGVLCFIDPSWPLVGGAFTIDGLDVLWPAKAAERVRTPGPISPYTVVALYRFLSATFPPGRPAA